MKAARAVLGCVAALAASACLAQAYPSKPVRLVTPFAPGGAADVMARLMGAKLSETLGQPVVVENRAGAGGVIGNDHVAKQPPDGYTLLLVTGAYPVQPAMLKSLPFDPLRDIQMLSMLSTYPFLVTVAQGSAIRSFAELVAHAKANPGKLNYSSAGIGSVHHLCGELFNALAGTDIQHVPTRGGATPLAELLGGRMDVLFETTTIALPQVQAGKLRALAVTARERLAALPGFEVMSFVALATTGGTPAPIVERLNRDIRAILAQPDTAKRFVELGGEPRATSPEEMRAFVEREIAKWRALIEQRKIERL